MEECFARRSVSNWKWLPWHSERNACRVSKNSDSIVSSGSLVSRSSLMSSTCEQQQQSRFSGLSICCPHLRAHIERSMTATARLSNTNKQHA
eukprot:4461462-Pyramimonas_sp.AAC.2